MTTTHTNGNGNTEPAFDVTPLYIQARDLIRQRILDRKYDHTLPNEADLARELRVSSGTMRKALDALEEEGFVVRMQGRGTFVRRAAKFEELSTAAKAVISLLTRLAPAGGGVLPGDDPADRMLVHVDDAGRVVRHNRKPVGYTTADLRVLAEGAADLRTWLEMRAAEAEREAA